MKVLVLGSTGMLGSYVTNYLTTSMGSTGRPLRVVPLNRNHFDASTRRLQGFMVDVIDSSDVVINCVGVLKPNISSVGEAKTIMINSCFPQLVSDLCTNAGARFIHICSDCVYSGMKGQYIETDPCDGSDLYAKTKAITPTNSTVIRTSFIGQDESITGKGLVKWLQSNSPGTLVTGYNNCMWNGVTAYQLAKIIENIIITGQYWTGIRHVFSPERVSKYDLCKMINDEYNLSLNIKSVAAESITGSQVPETGVLDRTLNTIYQPIAVPSLREQLTDMRQTKYHHACL